MNIMMLMMAGCGTRFGEDIPKQFVKVEGWPVFAYILDAYHRLPFIDKMIVVTHEDWVDYVEEWKEKLHLNKLSQIAVGGNTRSESVKKGLISIKEEAEDDAVILIHDATHPYVDAEGTLDVIEAVKQYGGATLGQCQYDTVYQMNEETQMLEKVVPRQQIVSGASPEAFFYKDIYRIYTMSPQEELERMTCAGALALNYGIAMKVIPSNVLNLKITYKNDMELFKQLLHSYFPSDSSIPADKEEG